MKNNITKIPVKYINGELNIESDKLLILSMLLQGRTSNNVTFLSIKYLCDRLDTTTILLYCKKNKISKYLMFNLFLYTLYKMYEKQNSIISINEMRLILDINKDTILRYFEVLEELNLIVYKCIGNVIRNGYKNITIVCANISDKDFLSNNIGNIAKELNMIEIHKRKDNDKNINQFKIYYKDLDELELKGLYLIRNLDNNTLKIGIANNFKLRFNEIKNSFKFCGLCPNLKAECFIETRHHYTLENYLHKEFEKYNIQNEWFNINDIQIIIDKLAKLNVSID